MKLSDSEIMEDALDVHEETGLTPRQLAEQRTELLGALKDIKHSIAQAKVFGNDWRRELVLIEGLVDAQLSKGSV